MNNENIENMDPSFKSAFIISGAYVDEQVAKGRHIDDVSISTTLEPPRLNRSSHSNCLKAEVDPNTITCGMGWLVPNLKTLEELLDQTKKPDRLNKSIYRKHCDGKKQRRKKKKNTKGKAKI